MSCCVRRWPLVFASLAVLSACSTGVDNPSAYGSERFLCAEQQNAEWQAQVEQCRASGSCGGVVSFRGVLEGKPITVDSSVESARFADFVTQDQRLLRDEINISGRSPYFLFTFQWKDIGGAIPDTSMPVLEFGGRGVRSALEKLSDDLVRASLRISAGGQSIDFILNEGLLQIEQQTAFEEAGSFQARSGVDDIEGCFHAFALERTFTREADANAGD